MGLLPGASSTPREVGKVGASTAAGRLEWWVQILLPEGRRARCRYDCWQDGEVGASTTARRSDRSVQIPLLRGRRGGCRYYYREAREEGTSTTATWLER